MLREMFSSFLLISKWKVGSMEKITLPTVKSKKNIPEAMNNKFCDLPRYSKLFSDKEGQIF